MFASHRQLVQHVAQRFGMHQAVLDGNFEQEAIFQTCEGGIFRGSPQ